MRNDVRLALRSFGREPLFAVVVVATLGIVFGANTAVFGALHAAPEAIRLRGRGPRTFRPGAPS